MRRSTRATLDAIGRAFSRVGDAPVASRASSSRARRFGTVRSTTTHEVVRERAVAVDGATTHEIGMSERAFDVIGDVRKIEARRAVGERARAETLLEISWRGCKSNRERRAVSREVGERGGHARDRGAVRLRGERDKRGRGAGSVRESARTGDDADRGGIEREGGARLMDEEAYETFVEAEEMAEADAANESYP